jgi:hypothetical protein
LHQHWYEPWHAIAPQLAQHNALEMGRLQPQLILGLGHLPQEPSKMNKNVKQCKKHFYILKHLPSPNRRFSHKTWHIFFAQEYSLKNETDGWYNCL